jgi:hypothetical protein
MAKDRNSLSIKELMNSDKSTSIETERLPKYIVHTPDFMCPISPYISWHKNLKYQQCPVIPSERDIPGCDKCIHKSNVKIKNKDSKKKHFDNKKDNRKTDKDIKKPIPKIGKTYVSK